MNQVKLLFLGIFMLGTVLEGYSSFVTACNFSYKTGNDRLNDIKPLPKIDKEFLVVLHIVKDINGGVGVNEAEVMSNIDSITKAFAPINASFTVCEKRYIENFRYDLQDDDRRKEMLAKYQVKNRINIFIVNDFEDEGKCGDADLEGVSSVLRVGIVIGKADCNNPATYVHEMGHFFGLKHTFEKDGDSDLTNDEMADGTNCETAGDGICDTPADPFVDGEPEQSYVNPASCLFISEKRDNNGDFYDPDVSNIMSYYSRCRCLKFTEGQYIKMVNNYLANPFVW